jgi:adhesin transport system outer membrane protein
MHIAQQSILTLQAYQQQMQRHVRAEVSPRIELELANSRILQMQVDLTAAEQNLKQALTRIEQYTGRNDLLLSTRKKDAFLFVAPTTSFEQLLTSTNWQAVTDQHPSIAKAKAESEQQKSKMDQKRAEAWPQIYARVSQPVFGSPQGRSSDPMASVGFKYTSAPGFSNQLQAKALATRIASAQELVAAAQINLQQTLRVDQDEYLNAKSKVEILERSVKGSESVLESYQRQFEGAKKTWQDLLNAVRELVQNQFALADARAAQLGAMHRLQIRTGQAIQ